MLQYSQFFYTLDRAGRRDLDACTPQAIERSSAISLPGGKTGDRPSFLSMLTDMPTDMIKLRTLKHFTTVGLQIDNELNILNYFSKAN